MPNPTIAKLKDQDHLIFTCYLSHETLWDEDKDGERAKSGDNEIIETWYPSIIIFDLERMCVADQIFGGEIFVTFDAATIYYVANEFYADTDRDSFEN